jgi:hypothetical protein
MKVKNRPHKQVVMKFEELVVLSVNARSLTATKRDHLLRLADICKAHVLCVQETWWGGNSKVGSRFNDAWKVFRKDRSRSGGGVMVAVRNNVAVLRSRVDQALELVGVEVRLNKSSSVWIESLYVPPGSGSPDLDVGLGESRGRRYVFGDLNVAAQPEWIDARIQDGWTLCLPDSATHIRGGTLDGALLSQDATGLTTVVLDDWLSDHATLQHRIGIEAEALYQKRPKHWVYSRADWEGYRTMISNEIRGSGSRATASLKYDQLVTAIGRASHACIPRAPRQATRPFWNEELETLRKSASDLRKAVRESRVICGTTDTLLQAAAETAEAALRAAVKSAQRESWKSFQVNESTNLTSGKVFWRLIRRLRSEGSGRDVKDAVRGPDGNLVTGSEADRLIREFFLSQSRTVRAQLRASRLHWNQPGEAIIDTELTADFNMAELKTVLSNTRTGSACGPDEISFSMLKELPEEGAELLLDLACTIWREGVIPGRLKEARLIRLDKPNSQDPYNISNLRFIAVESCIARVIEALVTARLGSVLERHSLLPEEAHGFRAGRSTISALRALRVATKTHAKGCQCCTEETRGRLCAVLQLDFERFYDRVTSNIICRKLAALGIGGRIPAFVHNWMSGRIAWISDRVGFRSRVGIPQGSPLSCNIANIYIADLLAELRERNFDVINYADDNNITARSSRRGDHIGLQAEELSLRLTEALTVAEEWATQSGAKLKHEKSKLSCFLPRNNRFEGKVLERINVPGIGKVVEPTILGVVLDRYGIGGKHVKARLALAGRRAGALKTLSHISLRVMRQLYIGGVRSCALYGVESFESLTETAIQSLERLQIGVLKYVGRLRDGVPSAMVGRLLRVPPVRLIIESRWKIREGMSRQAARKWIDEEWERRTPPEYLLPIAFREDPMWELPRVLQTVILRARSGYTLLQPAEAPFAPCNHPRCRDNDSSLSIQHILEDCHKYASRRRGLKQMIPGRLRTKALLWPTGEEKVATLHKVAAFLLKIGA